VALQIVKLNYFIHKKRWKDEANSEARWIGQVINDMRDSGKRVYDLNLYPVDEDDSM